MSGITLLLDGSFGQFVPQEFVNIVKTTGVWFNIETEDLEILEAGPAESDWYWETWETVLAKATFVDRYGNQWSLYQDGDLFAICESKMTDDEHYDFFGEYRVDVDTDSRFETDNWYDTSAELY
jgi:hypothetical protein